MKFQKKYERFIFALFMALIMVTIMSLFITFVNIGFVDNFFQKWLHSGILAFIVAFPTILIVVPIVRKLVAKVIKDG